MKHGYQVISMSAVCVDFDDGRSVSFPKGASFFADSNNLQVQRLLRGNAVRELTVFEQKPKEVVVGLSAADESLMTAHKARKQALRDAAAKPATPMTQKKGEVVQVPLKPAKFKDTEK
jgi:hypothetical protein